ncbi:MAG: chemotaxis protein CheW [Chlorobi bacterium]|nr:chemotaxis protein CheW [Chlorobiota bacterium]
MKNKYKFDSFLSFTLGEEYFAANVAKVLNILEVTKITKVPQAPKYMLGVINLRGNVLPLTDLRLKFGMEATKRTSQTCILVLDIEMDKESLHVGALVDSVQEVLEIADDNIQPPPNIGSKYQSEFIYGIAKNNEEFIMLLDMDKVFSADEIINLKQGTKASNAKKAEVIE